MSPRQLQRTVYRLSRNDLCSFWECPYLLNPDSSQFSVFLPTFFRSRIAFSLLAIRRGRSEVMVLLIMSILSHFVCVNSITPYEVLNSPLASSRHDRNSVNHHLGNDTVWQSG